MEINEEFHERRINAGLTQQEVANMAGVRQSTVSRFEGGQMSPTIRTLFKMVRALGATLSLEIIPSVRSDFESVGEIIKRRGGYDKRQ